MAYVSHEGEWRFRKSGKSADESYEQGIVGAEPEFVIANEFAYVKCRKVYTRNGERLQIIAPKRGHWTRLDPVELESLTWQPPDLFSALLLTNPEDEGDDECHRTAPPPDG